MILKKILQIRLYFVMYGLLFQSNYALSASMIKNDVKYTVNQGIIVLLENYFPAVIAQIIENYNNQQYAFFDLLSKYKTGISYSSFDTIEQRLQMSRDFIPIFHFSGNAYSCLYDSRTRSLELYTSYAEKIKVLMKVADHDHVTHKHFLDAYPIKFAILDGDFVIITFYTTFSYVFFPSDVGDNQKENLYEWVKSKRKFELYFFLRPNNDFYRLLLVHSYSNDFSCKRKIMTRILFNKNKEKPIIKSYYLPYELQSWYKIKKNQNIDENIFFIFGRNNVEKDAKFYIIYLTSDFPPLCAESFCDYIESSTVKLQPIIGINYFSQDDYMLQDYFIKNDETRPIKRWKIYELQPCELTFFE